MTYSMKDYQISMKKKVYFYVIRNWLYVVCLADLSLNVVVENMKEKFDIIVELPQLGESNSYCSSIA